VSEAETPGRAPAASAVPGRTDSDPFAAARAVADAVLYEGYVLYPYRASARKNQLRWQFGVLTPPAFTKIDPSERSWLRTECLLEPGPSARLSVRVRCLHAQHRVVEAAVPDPATATSAPGVSALGPAGVSRHHTLGAPFTLEQREAHANLPPPTVPMTHAGAPPQPGFAPVHSLKVDGAVYVEWDEAVDEVVDLPPLALTTLLAGDHEERFELPGGCEIENLHSAAGVIAGRLVRTRQPVDGVVRLQASAASDAPSLVKVAVTIENRTPWAGTAFRRDDVLGHALVAVHAMLAADDGSFVSLLDPPPAAAVAAAGCHNDGIFPVLIGRGDVILASPIILYDRPQVAPESPGDLYDATEIDEILALRVLTLTDEEKSEARATDTRAAAIIDRCDDMPPEMWSRLHGAIRALGPQASQRRRPTAPGPATPPQVTGPGPEREPEAAARSDPMADPTAGSRVPWWDPGAEISVDPAVDSVVVAGVEVKKGSSVRLRPSRRADAHDLFLRDMTATVAGVFQDVDGGQQVAVTLDQDPAREELLWQGRYLYFHPDEIIPLTDRDPR
jgi:hypothetical protein